jgi:hypothetical protein
MIRPASRNGQRVIVRGGPYRDQRGTIQERATITTTDDQSGASIPGCIVQMDSGALVIFQASTLSQGRDTN